MRKALTVSDLLNALKKCDAQDDVTCELVRNGKTECFKIKKIKAANGVVYIRLRRVSFAENITTFGGKDD